MESCHYVVFCNGGAGGLKSGVPSPSAALRRLLSHAELLKLCVPVAWTATLPVTVYGNNLEHCWTPYWGVVSFVSSQLRLWTHLRVAQRGPYFFSEAPSISFPGGRPGQGTSWPGHQMGVFLHGERGKREGNPSFSKEKTRAGSGIRKVPGALLDSIRHRIHGCGLESTAKQSRLPFRLQVGNGPDRAGGRVGS